MTGWAAEWAVLVRAVVSSHSQKHRPHPAVCFTSVMFEFSRLQRAVADVEQAATECCC